MPVGLRIFAALLALLCATGCERRPKRTLRTEPWPAPALSSAGPTAVARSLRYVVDSGRVRVELGGKGPKPQATLAPVTGSIELDPVEVGRSRASLEVDLLRLSVSTGGSEDPGLTARALEWLELGADRPPAERERDRFARLTIHAFESPKAGTDTTARHGRVTAHGALTLHHFRVPVELELEVDLGATHENRLTIRTQRPFVVSLAAHDILPRNARGELVAQGISEVGTLVGREARVSAELAAELTPPPSPAPTNP